MLLVNVNCDSVNYSDELVLLCVWQLAYAHDLNEYVGVQEVLKGKSSQQHGEYLLWHGSTRIICSYLR